MRKLLRLLPLAVLALLPTAHAAVGAVHLLPHPLASI